MHIKAPCIIIDPRLLRLLSKSLPQLPEDIFTAYLVTVQFGHASSPSIINLSFLLNNKILPGIRSDIGNSNPAFPMALLLAVVDLGS